jgi:hypothetical protein
MQVPESMTGYMSNVALPRVQNMDQVRELERQLMQQHISIKCEAVRRYNESGAHQPEKEAEEMIYFVRLSAQVYLQLSDFETMADAVLKLLPGIVA